MLTAYWDLELQIKVLLTDDPRVPIFPVESRDLAESILAKATIDRPEIAPEIKQQGGTYTTREKRWLIRHEGSFQLWQPRD